MSANAAGAECDSLKKTVYKGAFVSLKSTNLVDKNDIKEYSYQTNKFIKS